MSLIRAFGIAYALCACSSGRLSVGTRDARLDAVPVGIENVNNSPLKAREYRTQLRFVPRSALSVDRLYFGFNLRGASCAANAGTDGGGDGGVLDLSLVNVDANGLPSTEIAHETVSACERYQAARDEAGSNPVLVWMSAPTTLDADQPFALVVRNADPDPAGNFFSFHMPIADAELAGPQARNELDAGARGGVMGLDPREHVAWSEDAGSTWRYGAENGQYASFVGDRPATRVPQYGFRLSDGSALAAQPYYAYQTECSGCTAAFENAQARRELSVLGGLAGSDGDVGTLTVTNLDSGAKASCTPPTGVGLRNCTLDTPFVVDRGERYSLNATGAVALLRMDNAQRVMFPDVGTSRGELTAHQPEPAPGTNEKDVPSLWAGPL